MPLGRRLLAKAAPYPATYRGHKPPQQPEERNGDQRNRQRYPPMTLNILDEPGTVLPPAGRPNLLIGAVFTEPALVGGDTTIKLKSGACGGVIHRSIISDEAADEDPNYGCHNSDPLPSA
jgi:hypothetical protein